MPVEISVTIDSKNNVTVEPDPAKSGKGKNILFKWSILTDGWTFTRNGIDIHNHGGQFGGGGNPKAQGKEWHLVDKNDVVANFNYDVHVTKNDVLANLDPTIQNQGDK